ncbi:MAG: Na+/H+ antiporter NhaA [Candidatus Nanopelagicaceae bacterium]|nr:Na+/H+ antiporter NhaA [Candidatus Nanopelagicaceae bacterium]
MNSKNRLSIISPLGDFVRRESFGGLLIIFSAALGLFFANSGLKNIYSNLWEATFSIKLANFELSMDIGHVINDGLMTIFFFLVGLEIKRELSNGHLSSFRKALPSAVAALGGMAIPAFLFLLIADSQSKNGWGVAVATDIALALTVLTLVGKKAKESLRPFLLGLAVIDDIGAILIIAIFYSSGLSLYWTLFAIASLISVVILKKTGVEYRFAYIVAGLALWLPLYKTGIHPTLAGVILGLLTPASPLIQNQYIDQEELTNLETIENVKESQKIVKGSISTVEWLEHSIHPWSSYLIVPLFAFSNSGIEISTSSIQGAFYSSLFWAVFIGLVIGKPLGIFLSALAIRKLDVGELPSGSSLKDIFATGMAAGIGFTVAIFISKLAFTDLVQQEQAILGVLCASIVSGLLSITIFILNKVKN